MNKWIERTSTVDDDGSVLILLHVGERTVELWDGANLGDDDTLPILDEIESGEYDEWVAQEERDFAAYQSTVNPPSRARNDPIMEPTTDTSLITRVYASFSYNDVCPEIDIDDLESWDQPTIDRALDARLPVAYDAMARAIESRYPNATDIWIESTGWDGDFAQFTPRADNIELDLHDEFFFEWLSDITDSLGN